MTNPLASSARPSLLDPSSPHALTKPLRSQDREVDTNITDVASRMVDRS